MNGNEAVEFPWKSEQPLFRRKSLSGNWKTNVGQSILEEVAVQDKYRNWIDQVGGKKDGMFDRQGGERLQGLQPNY